MSDESEQKRIEEAWRSILTSRGGEIGLGGRLRHLFKVLPNPPRCRTCHAPFKGFGGALVRMLFRREPSRLNPKICNSCELFARKNPGGAEIEVALFAADIRGSTALAERIGDTEFSRLINRFYRLATEVLVDADALIERLIGDEVTALFLPGFIGSAYAFNAVEAARRLLSVAGHGSPQGPWIRLGIGVHQGTAFVGAVGSREGLYEITALGDTANITARLASEAGAGEILVSEAAARAAALETEPLERRLLQLKGRSAPLAVRVLPAP